MASTAEWRTKGDLVDAVLVLDENRTVREAFPANQAVLSHLLTRQLDDLDTWRGESSVDGDERRPEAWGTLVLARARSGEVLEVEPDLFWNGIYLWFRSQGVDYDTPGLEGDADALHRVPVNSDESPPPRVLAD